MLFYNVLGTRNLVGLLGSGLVHLAGAEAAAQLFEMDHKRLPTIVCLCGSPDDPIELRMPLLFVEASGARPAPGTVPTMADTSARPCPSEPPLERLAEPRPLAPRARQSLRKAALGRSSACVRISLGGRVLRAYAARKGLAGEEAELLGALRFVRFEAARRGGRAVTAWHRVTVQMERQS